MDGFDGISHLDSNLLTSAWIPVRWLDGRHAEVSLEEAFTHAGEIQDLDAPPHERIALLRLLLCITQAALGAPEDPSDWQDFGGDFEARILAYLHRPDITPHFQLFGDGPRFLQSPFPPGDKSYPISQASFTLATGNSPTLFDHFGEEPRALSPAFLARLLLTYQNFFIGGSMASKVKGNGPSLKMLHTYLTGRDLKHTLLSNCLDRETCPKMGRPYWELGTPDKIKGAAAREVTETHLGRLVPLSCRLWLATGNDGCARLHIDQGLQYPAFPEWVDPYATRIAFKEETRILRADVDRGIWRDLHCLTVVRKAAGSQFQSAPLVIQSHLREYEHQHSELDLWLGELIKAKDAKIIDAMEDRFTVPFPALHR